MTIPRFRPTALSLSISTLTASCAPPESSRASGDARCEFSYVESLGMVNSPAFDGSPTVSADETELFFTSERTGTQDLFVSTRPSKEAAWGEPVNLGAPIDDPAAGDFSLRLSNDGTALYFASNRSGGHGKADMYVATRASKDQPWSPAMNLGARLNTGAFEAFPTPSADGMTLYFNRSTSFDSEDSDIWMTTRSGPTGQWTEPERPNGINSERAEFSPSLSADGNALYFSSGRGGTVEVWVSVRGDRSQAWGAPRRLGADINAPGAMTLAPFVSVDHRSLYFMSARPNVTAGEDCTPTTCFERVDLYVATAICTHQ